MTIGRNNSRRRRVILEEVVQSSLDTSAAVDTAPESCSPDSQRDYSIAATRRGQWKTTDLIPKRTRSFLLMALATVSMLTILNFLAIRAPQWKSALPSEAMATLAISGVGSVSSWFSSFLFLLTSMASLQIYGMRRHRCDDYNGTYQIWLWMTLLFAVASIHCVVDFRWVAKWASQSLGMPGGRGLILLLAIKFVAMTALIVRGVLEIRASRSALVAVAIVWMAYSSAIFMQIPWSQNLLVSNDSMVFGNTMLCGSVAVFWATILYARHVYFHANGLLPVVEKPVENADSTKEIGVTSADSGTVEESKSTKKKRSKPKSDATPSPAPHRSTETPTPEPEDQDSDEYREEILNLEQQGALSKSERRRLKKLQRRQRKAA